MMILYFFIGFLAAVLAAAPPGAVNIAVINTSVKQTFQQALYVMAGAAIGEVILALIALHCTMNLTDFFKDNPWVQISVFLAFIMVGSYFLIRTKLKTTGAKLSVETLKVPKFVKGLLLAFINPPVLIFWVLAFTIIHKNVLQVTDMSPWIPLVLFFTGIFTGKIATLYSYSVWGRKLESSSRDTKKTVHRFIGVALVLLGLVQGIRFFLT